MFSPAELLALLYMDFDYVIILTDLLKAKKEMKYVSTLWKGVPGWIYESSYL